MIQREYYASQVKWLSWCIVYCLLSLYSLTARDPKTYVLCLLIQSLLRLFRDFFDCWYLMFLQCVYREFNKEHTYILTLKFLLLGSFGLIANVQRSRLAGAAFRYLDPLFSQIAPVLQNLRLHHCQKTTKRSRDFTKITYAFYGP